MREEPISDENKEQIRLDDDENVPSDIVQTQDGKYGVDVFWFLPIFPPNS